MNLTPTLELQTDITLQPFVWRGEKIRHGQVSFFLKDDNFSLQNFRFTAGDGILEVRGDGKGDDFSLTGTGGNISLSFFSDGWQGKFSGNASIRKKTGLAYEMNLHGSVMRIGALTGKDFRLATNMSFNEEMGKIDSFSFRVNRINYAGAGVEDVVLYGGEDEGGRLLIESCVFNVDGHRWSIRAPASIERKSDRIAVQNLQLWYGGSSVSLSVALAEKKTVVGTLSVASLPVATHTTIFGRALPDALLDATFSLHGPVGRPEFTGRGSLTVAGKNEKTVLQFDAYMEGPQLRIEGRLEGQGGNVTLRAALSVEFSLYPFAVGFDADRLTASLQSSRFVLDALFRSLPNTTTADLPICPWMSRKNCLAKCASSVKCGSKKEAVCFPTPTWSSITG